MWSEWGSRRHRAAVRMDLHAARHRSPAFSAANRLGMGWSVAASTQEVRGKPKDVARHPYVVAEVLVATVYRAFHRGIVERSTECVGESNRSIGGERGRRLSLRRDNLFARIDVLPQQQLLASREAHGQGALCHGFREPLRRQRAVAPPLHLVDARRAVRLA